MVAWTDCNYGFGYILLLFLKEIQKETPTS